jgi:hypothetical protein
LHLQTISRRRAAAKARTVNELSRQSGIVGLGRRCLD